MALYFNIKKKIRYNTERFSHGLSAAEPLSDFRRPIENGYFSKLVTTRAERDIPPRQDNVYLHDLRRNSDALILKISDLERFRDRIIECIDQGFVNDVRVIHYFINSNLFAIIIFIFHILFYQHFCFLIQMSIYCHYMHSMHNIKRKKKKTPFRQMENASNWTMLKVLMF